MAVGCSIWMIEGSMSTERLVGYLWGMGLVLVSAWPALRDPPVDSFPLSTYPMFSRPRGQPLIYQMVAVNRSSERQSLPPHLVANAETLQASAALQRAVATGQLATLCQEVASRVASDPEFAATSRLEIRAVRYNPISYFVDGRLPIESRRLHRCMVTR